MVPPLFRKILIAAALLAVFVFCMMGFLASFEPPGDVAMRIAYTVGGVLCLLILFILLIPRRPDAP